LSAVTVLNNKALVLRETTTSENGETLALTLIGIEEYPRVQAASFVFKI